MKHMKYQKLLTLIAIPAIGCLLLTTGCERTVSKTEEVHTSSDGTVKTKEKKVTENPDGTVTKTETRTTDKP